MVLTKGLEERHQIERKQQYVQATKIISDQTYVIRRMIKKQPHSKTPKQAKTTVQATEQQWTSSTMQYVFNTPHTHDNNNECEYEHNTGRKYLIPTRRP